MKHTKGEWRIDDMPLPSRKTVEIKHCGEVICSLKHRQRVKHYTLDGLPEMKANAKLIAAAPELLRALNTISEAFWTDGETEEEKISDLQNIATEAIKKATE